MGAFPYNTIGVYSDGEYFGRTRWRLGVIAVHERKLFDDVIARHLEAVKKKLDKRYGGLTLAPRKIAFIDRIVADSRDVALNHTAGLSLPQQVMMSLFSIHELMDEKKQYQKACISIFKKRVHATIEGLGFKVEENPSFDYYYGVIDLESWLRKYVDPACVAWIRKNIHPPDIVFRLADDYGIVLLNGGGFEAPDWSVRVSSANRDDHVYGDIGRAVRGYRPRACTGVRDGEFNTSGRQAQENERGEHPQGPVAGRPNIRGRIPMRLAATSAVRTRGAAMLALGLAMGFVAPPGPVARAAAEFPRVRVLATGGTIAGAQASATDSGCKSGAYDVNTLINAVPNLGKLAEISGEQVANIGSQDMNDEV
jgi:hypothetical protein